MVGAERGWPPKYMYLYLGISTEICGYWWLKITKILQFQFKNIGYNLLACYELRRVVELPQKFLDSYLAMHIRNPLAYLGLYCRRTGKS